MINFCKCKSYSHFFFSKNISIYAIFNDQSVNDTLTNGIVSFEELGPDFNESYVFTYIYVPRVFVHMRADQPVHSRSLIRAFAVR